MELAKYRRLALAAIASLTASLLLVAVPFASPSIPIAPFALANWFLFMLTGFIAFWPIRWPIPFDRSERAKLKIVMLVLIAFTVAGWVALANTERVV